jgi:hypothetical protein
MILFRLADRLLLDRGTMPCRHPSFDIPSTAGFYSTLAGVMAGFAFLALANNLLTVDRDDREDNPSYADAGIALGAAFVSLLLVSISYAILTGDRTSGPRAAVVEIIVGAAFAAAALQMIYAIGFLIQIHSERFERVKGFFRAIGIGLCPLGLLLVLLGSTDFMETRLDNGGPFLEPVGWALVILLGVNALTLEVAHRRKWLVPAWATPTMLNPSYVVVCVTAAAIVGCAVADSVLGRCATVSPFIVLAVIALATAVLLNQMIWFLRLTSNHDVEAEAQDPPATTA